MGRFKYATGLCALGGASDRCVPGGSADREVTLRVVRNALFNDWTSIPGRYDSA